MKLARIGAKGAEKPAILDADGQYRDASSLVPDFGPMQMTHNVLGRLNAADISKLPVLPNNARIGCPLSDTPNLWCIGLNYKAHAAETGSALPPEPLIFNKATSALNGPYDGVHRPRKSMKMDWEIELGVVIGREATYVSEADALDYVAGYVTAQDVSERDWQKERGGQWVKGKSGPGFAPLGPWIVTADEVADPQALDVWTTVNGKKMQASNTSDMIFSVAECISYMSQLFTLRVGDVILTGTPEGVGLGQKPDPVFLSDGDSVECGVEGLGAQRWEVLPSI